MFRRVLFWCAALLVVAIGPARAAAAAEPKPEPMPKAESKASAAELRRELAELERRLDRLIRTYNGKRVELQRARAEERAARERLRDAEEDYRAAARQVAELANLRYRTSGLDLPNALFGPGLGNAAVLEHLAAQRTAALGRYAAAQQERRKAADQATRLAERVRGQADEVDAERKRAERLIARIKKRLDRLVPLAPGRLPGGGFAPELPGGPDNITPRTRLMRDLVTERFPTGFATGCFRAVNDGGEHPLGRACDFMLSSGGAMPTPEKVALGHRIAEFLIEHGRRLGVKYVIYRQRIYHMSTPGWRPMADRGSITANHFDHVHVSML